MKYLFAMFLLTMVSCAEKEDRVEVPQEWVDLIFDIQTARISAERAAPDDRDSLGQVYHQQILELHDMSQEEYDRMIDHLYDNPDVMDSIYLRINGMIDSLKAASRKN